MKDQTKKIADAPADSCRDPQHSPPGFRVFEPGLYEHTCPGCGHKTRFSIPRITL